MSHRTDCLLCRAIMRVPAGTAPLARPVSSSEGVGGSTAPSLPHHIDDPFATHDPVRCKICCPENFSRSEFGVPSLDTKAGTRGNSCPDAGEIPAGLQNFSGPQKGLGRE
jgi:hypothetical protein